VLFKAGGKGAHKGAHKMIGRIFYLAVLAFLAMAGSVSATGVGYTVKMNSITEPVDRTNVATAIGANVNLEGVSTTSP